MTDYIHQIHDFGGIESLQWSPFEVADPAPHEVVIRHTAIGLNFIDVYHRTGLYPLPLPATPGLEGVGVVEAVGSDVTRFVVGDRVGYPAGPIGAYATRRVIPVDNLVRIPDSVSDEDAAALLLKGCTVEFLVRRLYSVKAGDTVLLHAAAGGVGLIASQWLAALGAIVIGTAGGPEKVKLANDHGCNLVVDYRDEDFVEAVMDMTGGKGVPVVYDSVGAATFDKSLQCLARRGTMVTYGNATGPVPPVPPVKLAQGGAQGGSLFLTRPSLTDYITNNEELEASTNALFEMVGKGQVKASIYQRFALEEAGKAHSALEARDTRGQTILLP